MKFRVIALALSTTVLLAACSKQEEVSTPAVEETTLKEVPLANPAPQGKFYITNQKGPVSIYSLADYSKLGEISVGQGGRGMGLVDDERLLAIAVPATNDIAVIDLASRTVVRRVPVGHNPEIIRVQGMLAYATLDPQAKGSPTKLAVFDLSTGEKTKELDVGLNVLGMELSADNKHILLTHDANETLSVHELETGKLLKTIETREYGIRPRGIARSPNGEHFAVTLEYSNKILILNSDYTITQEIPTGEVPYGISYNRAGTEIFVALARGKAIQVFDTETFKLKREIPIGERCLHFSLTPDDENLVVACGRSNSVLVLDAETGELIKELPEPERMPWGVVVMPKSVGSLSSP